MKTIQLSLIALLLTCVFFGFVFSCGDDDDDDDDDNDEESDDDDDDDNDNDDETCDGYDVVIDGITDFNTATSEWTANLTLDEGDLAGVIIPDNTDIDPYNVTGAMTGPATGNLTGSFATPATMATLCPSAEVTVVMTFSVVGTAISGDGDFHCGDVNGTVFGTYPLTGEVTCGGFS